jgi:hypothetical protein
MVVHTSNTSTLRERQKDLKFKVMNLGYIVLLEVL